MEQVMVPSGQNQLLKKLLRGSIAALALLLFGAVVFYGGYQYAWYQTNWSVRLARKVPFVAEYSKNKPFPEGVFRERDFVVLFGRVGSFNRERSKLNVVVYDSQFVITIRKNTQIDFTPVSLPEARAGDYVRLDMKYSEPFVANKIIFTRQSQ